MSDIQVKRFHRQCTLSPLFLWIRPTHVNFKDGHFIFFYFRQAMRLTWLSRSGISLLSIFCHIQSISMPSTSMLAKVLSPCNVSHHDEEDFWLKFLKHWAEWFFLLYIFGDKKKLGELRSTWPFRLFDLSISWARKKVRAFSQDKFGCLKSDYLLTDERHQISLLDV